MTAFDLLSIGEAMAEISCIESPGSPTEFEVGVAGDTYNTAVYCKRILGQRGAVAFASRVGNDALSSELLSSAKREGLDVSQIAVDPTRAIGIYSVSTDEQGERRFTYWRERSAARTLFSGGADIDLPAARISYLSGITLAILTPAARSVLLSHLSAASEAEQTLVAFDSNYRPGLWESETVARQTIDEMWQIADIALPSVDDERALFGDASEEHTISRFLDRPWTACAIKRGERGPVSPTFEHPSTMEFPAAANVVDTTAAGDSFNAGYLAGFLKGEAEFDCLQRGHNLAAQVIAGRGAILPRDEQPNLGRDAARG